MNGKLFLHQHRLGDVFSASMMGYLLCLCYDIWLLPTRILNKFARLLNLV